jgi:hypothetical protein
MAFLRAVTANGRRAAWGLKLDVASFFPSMHKETLYEIIARHVRHPELLWLTRALLFHDPTTSYHFRSLDRRAEGPGRPGYPVPPRKSLFGKKNERGLPLGNLTRMRLPVSSACGPPSPPTPVISATAAPGARGRGPGRSIAGWGPSSPNAAGRWTRGVAAAPDRTGAPLPRAVLVARPSGGSGLPRLLSGGALRRVPRAAAVAGGAGARAPDDVSPASRLWPRGGVPGLAVSSL